MAEGPAQVSRGDAGTWAVPAGVLLLGGLVAVALVFVVLRRPGGAGRWLAVVLGGLGVWSFAGAAEVATADLDTRLLWGDLKYIGIGLLPPAWLAFAAHYTGRGHLVTRRRVAALAVPPVVVLMLLAGESTGDLIRYFGPEAATEDFPFVEAGPLFWPWLVYSDGLLLLGSTTLVAALTRTSRVYWRASAALIAATVLPWLVNLAYNLEIAPFAPVDYTPTAFVASAAVLVWGVFHQHLLSLVPAAHRTVMDTMAEGVLVLDPANRVVDSNRSARAILGRSDSQILGRTAGQLLPSLWSHVTGNPEQPVELFLPGPGGGRTYELALRALPGVGGRHPGRLVVLRDVTERQAQQERLRAALAERSNIAAALEQSLRPASLPAVPGVELAARYRPASGRGVIGGDFYDAVRQPDGSWAVVLGDVSGKGAEAAALTALVRYTLRTLSMLGHQPVELLHLLDGAVRAQAGDERFCTAALAVLRPAAGWVDLAVTLAGQPRPLVVRRDRSVQPVGLPGALLGLLPDPPDSRTEVELRLLPGELLLLYSDGVTDAQRDGRFLEEPGLIGLVNRACAVAPPRADDLAAAVAEGAVAFQGGATRDDVTVLAVRACPG